MLLAEARLVGVCVVFSLLPIINSMYRLNIFENNSKEPTAKRTDARTDGSTTKEISNIIKIGSNEANRRKLNSSP